MIRIVCPFCHIPLATDQLEMATCGGQACLVCPECENILLTETAHREAALFDAPRVLTHA
jgi:hypothetical protein